MLKRLTIITLSLLCGFLAMAGSPEKPYDIPAMTTEGTVVFLGDSLTSGYGVTPEESLPALTQKKINASGMKFNVINAGKPGDTSKDALARAKELFKKQKTDVLVLFIGANDGLSQMPVSQLENNLVYMIYYARMANPRTRILFLGIHMPEEMGSYALHFNELYPRVAYRRRVAILPWIMEGLIGDRSVTLADGFHPNPEGYKIMSDRLWAGLEPILVKSAADLAAAAKPAPTKN